MKKNDVLEFDQQNVKSVITKRLHGAVSKPHSLVHYYTWTASFSAACVGLRYLVCLLSCRGQLTYFGTLVSCIKSHSSTCFLSLYVSLKEICRKTQYKTLTLRWYNDMLDHDIQIQEALEITQLMEAILAEAPKQTLWEFDAWENLIEFFWGPIFN